MRNALSRAANFLLSQTQQRPRRAGVVDDALTQ
jgi:hypothetical protein